MNSTLRKILFRSLSVRTLSGDINASFLVAIQANSKCMEEIKEESSGKRPHVSTGNTLHKPDYKRCRSTGSFPTRGKSAKKLYFPESSKYCEYLTP